MILLDGRDCYPRPDPGPCFRRVGEHFEALRPITADELIGAANALLAEHINEPPKDAPAANPSETSADPLAALKSWLVLELSGLDHEILLACFFNCRGRLSTVERIEQGNRNSITVWAPRLLRRAVAVRAVSAILVHNHPHGNAEPSGEDVETAAALSSVLAACGVELADSWIVGGSSVTSLADTGRFTPRSLADLLELENAKHEPA